ncbi:MAG: hypothetical protein ACLQU1_18015 [Bryobacteraceae bacterium]
MTSACHFNMRLDEVGRRLAGLLDGTRSHEEIAEALNVEYARELLGPSLQWMASHGLLEG